MRPDALVASLLDGDQPVSARDLGGRAERRVESRTVPQRRPHAKPPAPVIRESLPPKKLPVAKAQVPTAVEQETIVAPVDPPPVPKVESVTKPTPPPPPPVVEKIEIAPVQAPTARDIAEQEIVDLILRAQRVAKSTGAPLEVCLEELRRHLQPVIVEAAPKQAKVRRFEFQSSPDGLLTGAKITEE